MSSLTEALMCLWTRESTSHMLLLCAVRCKQDDNTARVSLCVRILPAWVGGTDQVTHASQGCDMPGSRQGSRWAVQRTHTPFSLPLFLCEGVSGSDRHLKADGKQRPSQARPGPARCFEGSKDKAESRVLAPDRLAPVTEPGSVASCRGERK